jgi:CRP/FNR family transcriptional regulator, cyclic AMP receptor protein
MTAPSGSAELLTRIASFPFFEGFDAPFLGAIAPGATERTYETGAEVVREGAAAAEFFLVRHGKIGLEVGSPDRPHRTIQTVGPGEVLGWSWLVPPHRWHFDARALKPTRVIVLDAGTLRAALADRPEAGYRFLLRLLPVIAERLENARLQLLDLHGV